MVVKHTQDRGQVMFDYSLEDNMEGGFLSPPWAGFGVCLFLYIVKKVPYAFT